MLCRAELDCNPRDSISGPAPVMRTVHSCCPVIFGLRVDEWIHFMSNHLFILPQCLLQMSYVYHNDIFGKLGTHSVLRVP